MPGRFALLLGVSDFDEPKLQRLHSPEPDIEKLEKLLSDPSIGGYAVEKLVNGDLISASRMVQRFFGARAADETALLYFAGHGVRSRRGTLCFPFKNTELDFLDATAMQSAFLPEQLDQSLCDRQIVILDCCNSAAFLQGARHAPGSPFSVDEDLGRTESGRVIITASKTLNTHLIEPKDKRAISTHRYSVGILYRHLRLEMQTLTLTVGLRRRICLSTYIRR